MNDSEDSASSKVRCFFRPEDAPTDRLRTMDHFWDSEVGLQLLKLHPNATVETLPALETNISNAVGDTSLDYPLTVEEAQFLLNHREPILFSHTAKS